MRTLRKKDAELIKGFLLGEKQASETIDCWIATAVRVTLGERGEDIKDLEQDIRHKLILDFREQNFRYDCDLKTYVCRIAQFTCIDHLRRKKRTPQYESIEDVESELVDAERNPLELVEAKDERTIFEKIFAQWPEMCRQLWKLLCKGYSYREISKRLSIAEDTVRTRLFRCKQMATNLRIKLTGEGNI